MKRTLILLAASGALMLSALPAATEEDTSPAAAPSPATTPLADAAPRVATPEEKAEKEARKACKIKLCAIVASKDPAGEDVACDIVKTWREADIAKILGGKIDWPWGKAVCQSKLELKRKPLALAMGEAAYAVSMPTQTVRCTLAQKEKGDPYVVEIAITPKVDFENGKAVKAQLNWGEASAPMLVYALIYAGTGLDNSANVLGPEVVRMVNEFTTKKCAEVKDELPAPGPN
jgi:hypothetical protein